MGNLHCCSFIIDIFRPPSPTPLQEVYQWSFEATYVDAFGTVCTVSLKEGGESIPVTSSNRQEYVDLVVDVSSEMCYSAVG